MAKELLSGLVPTRESRMIECRILQTHLGSESEVRIPPTPDLLNHWGWGLGITVLSRFPDDSQAYSRVCRWRPDFSPEFWTRLPNSLPNSSTWMSNKNRKHNLPKIEFFITLKPPIPSVNGTTSHLNACSKSRSHSFSP